MWVEQSAWRAQWGWPPLNGGQQGCLSRRRLSGDIDLRQHGVTMAEWRLRVFPSNSSTGRWIWFVEIRVVENFQSLKHVQGSSAVIHGGVLRLRLSTSAILNVNEGRQCGITDYFYEPSSALKVFLLQLVSAKPTWLWQQKDTSFYSYFQPHCHPSLTF